MSSGVGKTFGWTLKFPEQRASSFSPRPPASWQHQGLLFHPYRFLYLPAERWSNPLTGWTSSSDPMTSVELVFDTKEMAIAYVEKKGSILLQHSAQGHKMVTYDCVFQA